MSIGLIALLDDVASLAKAASASLDDIVTAGHGRATNCTMPVPPRSNRSPPLDLSWPGWFRQPEPASLASSSDHSPFQS
jgi:hypothetical protein